MPVTNRDARGRLSPGTPRSVRARGGTLVLRKRGLLAGLAAAILGLSAGSPELVAAYGSTRTISLYHIHTQERLSVTYKKDGKYDPEALKKINWLMRDWRLNEATEMDPRTIDLLWEMHTELGSKEPISIICGFRSEKTNNMLRRTVGGQAKQSFHISGKAIDATFPDISLKQMRYSALIRERGGVGYYPTSGIPFVHVDSGPVRAWPRLPRNELALLFPNGKTKHKPAGGDSISLDDVRVARARNKELAQQVAAYIEIHNHPKPAAEVVQVAEADDIAQAAETVAPAAPPLKVPAPQPVRRSSEIRVASLETDVPVALPAAAPVVAPAPKLVRAPGPAVPPPNEAERGRLNALVTLASLTPSDMPARQLPQADRSRLDALVSTATMDGAAAPPPAAAPAPEKTTRIAALEPTKLGNDKASLTDAEPSNWAPAPEFDEDHPEELSYRPFPVAPLLTQSASADDSALIKIKHPDLARTLDLLDEDQVVLPLRLRPGKQTAEVMWAQRFKGDAVDLSVVQDRQLADEKATGLTSRAVKTTAR